jgi:hypothetical protein
MVWLIVAVLAVVAGLSAAPASRAIKSWHAQRLAGQAERLIEREEWTEASRKIQAAMRLRPTEPAVWIATARLLSRTGRGELAFDWWSKVAAGRPLSLEDRRDFATAALIINDLRTAGDQIEVLIGGKTNPPPADALLAAQYAAARGNRSEARARARAILSNSTITPRQETAAASILVSNSATGAEERRAGFARLAQIARDEREAASLNALLVLVHEYLQLFNAKPSASSSPPLTTDIPIPPSELADRLEQHPRASPAQRIMAIEIRVTNEPTREEEWAKYAIKKFGHGDDENTAALCDWLYARRKYDAVLRILPLEKASRTQKLLMERLDSLAQLGRFDALKEVLITENPVLETAFQHALLAVVRLKLGETSASENEWSRALAEADNTQKLMGLGLYAEKNGAIAVADSAYARAILRQGDLRAAYLSRLRIAQTTEDTAKAYEIAGEIRTRWPDDRPNVLNEIFLRLLKDPSAESGRRAEFEIAPLLASDPADAMARRTMALALLREGRGAAALEILPQPERDDPPSAVLAAAWAANGWKDKARDEAHRLTTEKLFPEERALIAGIPK